MSLLRFPAIAVPAALTLLAASPAGAMSFSNALASPYPYLVLAVASALAGIAWFAFHLRYRNRRVLMQSKTTRIRMIALRKLCTAIIVAPSVEESPLSRSLEPWLTGLGFTVMRIENLELLANAVDFTPTITAVDCEMGGRIVSRIESHFQSMSLSASATVIFYNAQPGILAEKLRFLKNVHYLAGTFSRAEIVRIIAPLLTIETVSERPPAMTLEGELGDQATRDILEYIESGSRTGVLTIRDSDRRVQGVVGVENGAITFARTERNTGENAVIEVLTVSKGFFQFRAEQPGLKPNCCISPTFVILQRAQKMDESRREAGSAPLQPLTYERTL
jgi:hypothetical protein